MELSRKQWVLVVTLCLLFIAMGGVAGFLFAAILSFVPAYYYLRSIRNSEVKDKEPWDALKLAFAWGAISGVFLAMIFNTIGTSLLLVFLIQSGPVSEDLVLILSVVVVAPIVEEFVKPLVMFQNLSVRSNIDEVEDGIVYGAACGLGFGATENVLYGLSEEAVSVGYLGILAVVILRTVSSILLHSVATSFTGHGISKHLVEGQPFSVVIKYYLLAVLIHSAWNGAAVFSMVYSDDLGGVILLIFSIMLAIGGLEFSKRRIREIDMEGSNIMMNQIRSNEVSKKWGDSSKWDKSEVSTEVVSKDGYTSPTLYSTDDRTKAQNWFANIDWKSAVGTGIFLLFILGDMLI
jgi:RsiW-degrading membrane proteinase PrsW (M82 family)